MDQEKAKQHLQAIDGYLYNPALLRLRGGAACLLLGNDRSSMDFDVLPSSEYDYHDLRQATERAGMAFDPDPELVDVDQDYISLVPEKTLVLPKPSPKHREITLFKGEKLEARCPPIADLVVSKLKRLDPADMQDVAFLIEKYRLTSIEIRAAYKRLPQELQADLVLRDNLDNTLRDHFPNKSNEKESLSR